MKRRTNITVEESLYAKAQAVMEARDFSDFSGFLEQLIREEWERRNGPASVRSPATRPGSGPRGRGEAPAAGSGLPVEERADRSGPAAQAAAGLPPVAPVSSSEVLRVAEASIPAAVEASRGLPGSRRRGEADEPSARRHRPGPAASQGA